MRKTLITIAALGLPASALAAAAAIDQQEHRRTYRTDWTFSGFRAVVEHDSGKLGFRHGERIVGYFVAGKPRVIGFGCDGATNPVIAAEEDALPSCRRVEPVL